MNNEELKKLTDEQLAVLAQQGNADAEELLLTANKDKVLSRAALYYIIGADRDDVVQEGMIGLVKAIRSYKADSGVSFASFAYTCITHQIITAIRAAARAKHSPLNDAVSLDQPVIWNTEMYNTLAEAIPAGAESDPENVAIKTELLQRVFDQENAGFSTLEHATIKYLTQGKSYREIADLLGKTPKQIDNTIQRIRAKMQKLL